MLGLSFEFQSTLVRYTCHLWKVYSNVFQDLHQLLEMLNSVLYQRLYFETCRHCSYFAIIPSHRSLKKYRRPPSKSTSYHNSHHFLPFCCFEISQSGYGVCQMNCQAKTIKRISYLIKDWKE